MEMLPGGTGGFVPVDRIRKWKTDFSTASFEAEKRAQEHTEAVLAGLGSSLSRCSEAWSVEDCFSPRWASSWHAQEQRSVKSPVLMLLSLPCEQHRAVLRCRHCVRKSMLADPTL